MRTADGYLMIGAAGEPIWVRCAEALEHKEWCDDPLCDKPAAAAEP
jgi:crotonobetainyl-CoA:carnitine CoA-transferase CaiB-like acyl-CoA transferase